MICSLFFKILPHGMNKIKSNILLYKTSPDIAPKVQSLSSADI